MIGVIKKLVKDRHFGFISSDELKNVNGGKDIFFHVSGLVDTEFDDLSEGDSVSFDTENSVKGLNAVNVQRA